MTNLLNFDNQPSFRFEDIESLAARLQTPVIRGRVTPGEHGGNEGWSIECRTFEEFSSAANALNGQMELFVYDEALLDEFTLEDLGQELHRIADEDDNFTHKSVDKALSALRSYRNELFAVTAYAFLKSGRVLLFRHETDLASFITWPDRLLSPDGLAMVRKLRNLEQ